MFVYKCLCGHMPSFLLGIFLQVELPSHIITLCLTFCQFPLEKLVIFYYLESLMEYHPALCFFLDSGLLASLCLWLFLEILAANLVLTRFAPAILYCLHLKLRRTPNLPTPLIREWLSRQALTWCPVGLAVIPVCQGLGR